MRALLSLWLLSLSLLLGAAPATAQSHTSADSAVDIADSAVDVAADSAMDSAMDSAVDSVGEPSQAPADLADDDGLETVGVPPNVAAPPKVAAAPRRAVVPQSQERIVDFHSDIVVQADGAIVVAERLVVDVQGREIQRGLLRDFPTDYRNPDGSRVRVGFEVIEVSRNGLPEHYEQERLSNGVRLRIGSGGLLEHGQHQYLIRYRTTRQIGFFDEFDELYWNVTGTGWTLPIEQARARISLPAQVDILQTAIYTGPQGATGKDARETTRAPGTVSFETTAPLAPAEGLTIAAAWPKGVVQAPTAMEQLVQRLRENLALLVSAAGFVLLSLFYGLAWRRTRRRSPPRIVPLYEAPDGMSAPAVRYVTRHGYDQRTFVTGMLQMIANRTMRQHKTGTATFFERLSDHAGDPLLDGMLRRLFGKDTRFRSEPINASRFDDARSQLERDLTQTYRDKLFHTERKTAIWGTLLWLAYAIVIVVAAARTNADYGAKIGMGVLMTAPLLMMIVAGVGRGARIGVVSIIFVLVMVLPWTIAGLFSLYALGRQGPLAILPAVLPLLLLPVTVRAYRFLKVYTEEGYRVMDGIAGLRKYLVTAEGPRLQRLVTPQEQLDFYERLLPYAVALDVGKEWAASFTRLFTITGADAAMLAMRDAYGGLNPLRDDPDRMVQTLSRDVSPPRPSTPSSGGSPGSSGGWSSGGGSRSSSSSGSSGRGSSGGGGGGGGGSGW